MIQIAIKYSNYTDCLMRKENDFILQQMWKRCSKLMGLLSAEHNMQKKKKKNSHFEKQGSTRVLKADVHTIIWKCYEVDTSVAAVTS